MSISTSLSTAMALLNLLTAGDFEHQGNDSLKDNFALVKIGDTLPASQEILTR